MTNRDTRVAVGGRQSGKTHVGCTWVLDDWEHRAIVVAYDNLVDPTISRMWELVERGYPNVLDRFPDEVKRHAALARRVLTIRQFRSPTPMLIQWSPALWLDDVVELARQALRAGATTIGGYGVPAGRVQLLGGPDASYEDTPNETDNLLGSP